MKKKNIDVIVIKGALRSSEDDKSYMVQEYTGDALLLNNNHLLNIYPEGKPFNLTEYIDKCISNHDGVSRLVINYVCLDELSDVLNPTKILKYWKESYKEFNAHRGTKIIDIPIAILSKELEYLQHIDTTPTESKCVYMEIYVYYGNEK